MRFTAAAYGPEPPCAAGDSIKVTMDGEPVDCPISFENGDTVKVADATLAWNLEDGELGVVVEQPHVTDHLVTVRLWREPWRSRDIWKVRLEKVEADQ